MDKMYKVAGHVFKLSLDEQSPLWGHLTNYEPFETSPVSEPLFSLDLSGTAPEGSYELILDPEVEKGETVIKVSSGRTPRYAGESRVRRPLLGTAVPRRQGGCDGMFRSCQNKLTNNGQKDYS